MNIKPPIIYEFPDKDFCVAFLKDNQTFFTFDKKDRYIVERHSWREDKDGYIQGHIVGNHNKYERLHRVIKKEHGEDINGKMIDHKNHIIKDNRDNNLRICTNKENLLNANFNIGKTGYKNIDYKKKDKVFRIRISGKEIGRYKDLDKAIKIRDEYYKNNPNEFYYNESEDMSNIEYKISINSSPYDAFYIADGLTPPITIKPFKFIK